MLGICRLLMTGIWVFLLGCSVAPPQQEVLPSRIPIEDAKNDGLLTLTPSLVPTATAVPPTKQEETNVAPLGNGLKRVSVTSDGAEAVNPDVPADSSSPAISANGRYIAFSSRAANLVQGDSNGVDDLFVYDQQTGVTERVSLASDGTEATGSSFGPSLSANGRYVAFQSSGLLVNGVKQEGIFVHDRQTGQTELVSHGNGTPANAPSYNASLSPDGQFVVFVSEADNLVAADTNNWLDIFLRDRQTGRTERINVASDGGQSNGWSYYPTVSENGRFVAYLSDADNLVPEDDNGILTDVFVYDRTTQQVERIALRTACEFARISADGQWVVMLSRGGLWLHDRVLGETRQVQTGVGSVDISANGRYLAWGTAGEGQVFVYDQQTDHSTLITVGIDGTPSYGFAPAVAADGQSVAFLSFAPNLVANDTNGSYDVFVYNRSNE